MAIIQKLFVIGLILADRKSKVTATVLIKKTRGQEHHRALPQGFGQNGNLGLMQPCYEMLTLMAGMVIKTLLLAALRTAAVADHVAD